MQTRYSNDLRPPTSLRSNATPTPAGASRESLPYFATPHDQALSAIRSQLGTADGITSPSANTSPIGFMSSPSSLPGVSQDSDFHREVLTDPYDGTTLGIMIFTTDPSANPQTSGDHNDANTNEHCRNEELWTQLSRITDLQTEIARMHLDMEGISVGKGKGKMGERKNRRQRKSGEGIRHSQSDGGLEEYDVEGGMGMDDEETEQNRARQEEFTKLADQFEGRKESIDDIMTKLDDLSKVLTEFHALQAPEIKMPSSRKDSNGL
ncbi:hypothetical protein JOM56_006507 [Amanita muscaria]